MLDMNSVKRDIKAGLKPRKVIRSALIPQFGGLMTPVRDVFGMFVRTIGLMFVHAKLIPANHPAMTGETKGLGALWLMVLDGSKDLKFRKESANQLLVFYAVIGMLVFGVLSTLTFVTNLALGHAHAQGIFTEPTNINAAGWLECLFDPATPGACVANGHALSPIVTAITTMLITYNTGILVLASIFALWSLITMVVESGHHGQWGGTRHNALYAPLRIVLAIGMLVPLANGYSSVQMISVLLAHAGSGLANKVWTGFQGSLTSNLAQSAPSQVASVNWNPILQNLVIDETCLYAVNSNGGNSVPTTPTFAPQPVTNPISGVVASYKIDFNRSANYTSAQIAAADAASGAAGGSFTAADNMNNIGNDYCGSVTISAQISQLSNTMTPYTFANGVQKVLSDIWTNVATPIVINGPAVNIDPTKNPLDSSQTWGWANLYTNEAAPVQQLGPTVYGPPGPGGTLVKASLTINNQYVTNVLSNELLNTPTTTDWTTAGFVFLQMAHVASDMYTVENPLVNVALPDPEIMPASSSNNANSAALASCATASTGWFAGAKPYVCTTPAAAVTAIIKTAIGDVSDGEVEAGVVPGNMNPGSVAGQSAGGSYFTDAVKDMLTNVQSGFALFNGNSNGAGNPVTGSQSITSVQYSIPHVGQSIFNTLYLGELIMNAASIGFMAAAALGLGVVTGVAGEIVAAFSAMMFPVGAMLAIMIPLLPAVRFFFGIMTWLMTIFESLVALPVVALWSLRTDGEGLFAHGQQGYLTILQMMLRPVLMLFGLIGSVLVFDTLAGFLNQTVFATWNNVWANSNIVDQFLAMLGFLYFYVMTLYMTANVAFGMINAIPDRILQWIGTGLSIHSSGDGVAQSIGENVGTAMVGPSQGMARGAGRTLGYAAQGVGYGARAGVNALMAPQQGGSVEQGGNSNPPPDNSTGSSQGGGEPGPAPDSRGSGNAEGNMPALTSSIPGYGQSTTTIGAPVSGWRTQNASADATGGAIGQHSNLSIPGYSSASQNVTSGGVQGISLNSSALAGAPSGPQASGVAAQFPAANNMGSAMETAPSLSGVRAAGLDMYGGTYLNAGSSAAAADETEQKLGADVAKAETVEAGLKEQVGADKASIDQSAQEAKQQIAGVAASFPYAANNAQQPGVPPVQTVSLGGVQDAPKPYAPSPFGMSFSTSATPDASATPAPAPSPQKGPAAPKES